MVRHRTRTATGARIAGPGSRGQSLIEFTLVALLLIWILVGIIDFARLFFTYASVANAAREGARYGIINPTRVSQSDYPDPDNITARASSRVALIGDTADPPIVSISFPDGCQLAGCRVQVQVSAYYKSWTPLIPRVSVVGRSVMYIE